MSDKKKPFIKDFEVCPDCGSNETCARQGSEGVIDIPEGQVASFSQEIIFLKQPQLAVISVPALVAHYDICAGCGRRRCIRVERRELPVQHRPAPGMSPFGMPPGAAKR